MQETDSETAARLAAGPIADSRAAHYWDARRHLTRDLGVALGISAGESLPLSGGAGAAWDVYPAYAPGDTDIRLPCFWMHQLAVKHAPRLDVVQWRRGIEGLLQTGP
jgi:hypothetical protein